MGAFGGIEISVETLLLLVLDFFAEPWAPANLFYSKIKSAGRLTQELYQTRDSETIAKDGGLIVTFLNRLADLLDIKFLELLNSQSTNKILN